MQYTLTEEEMQTYVKLSELEKEKERYKRLHALVYKHKVKCRKECSGCPLSEINLVSPHLIDIKTETK